MKLNVVGVDIAKRVFQLHWVAEDTGEIVSLQLKREKFVEHFANRAPCLMGMEACGGSQHWARELSKLGHEVKLLSARWVKPMHGRLGRRCNRLASRPLRSRAKRSKQCLRCIGCVSSW